MTHIYIYSSYADTYGRSCPGPTRSLGSGRSGHATWSEQPHFMWLKQEQTTPCVIVSTQIFLATLGCLIVLPCFTHMVMVNDRWESPTHQHMYNIWYPLVIKCGNRMWQWRILYQWRLIAGKTSYNWWIFQCRAWLPEGMWNKLTILLEKMML